MEISQTQQEDINNLRLLSIFHYLMGGFLCVLSFFFLIYILLGFIFILVPIGANPEEECLFIFLGIFLIFIGVIAFIFQLLKGLLTLLSGKYLKHKTHYTFSFVIACLECLAIPLGTLLGVYTLVILNKSSVKALYNKPIR